jgi:hypothetical protein
MLDLIIECLCLQITNAAGHEHRVQPIALLALDLLTTALDERQGGVPHTRIEHLEAPAVRLDLNRMSDAGAAQAVADAWLEALALKLRV